MSYEDGFLGPWEQVCVFIRCVYDMWVPMYAVYTHVCACVMCVCLRYNKKREDLSEIRT